MFKAKHLCSRLWFQLGDFIHVLPGLVHAARAMQAPLAMLVPGWNNVCDGSKCCLSARPVGLSSCGLQCVSLDF